MKKSIRVKIRRMKKTIRKKSIRVENNKMENSHLMSFSQNQMGSIPNQRRM